MPMIRPEDVDVTLPPLSGDTSSVLETEHVSIEVLDSRRIQLVPRVFEIFLTLDQVGERGVNHVARRRIVVRAVGDDPFRLIDQSLTLV
jgi:hypothetical protein